MAVDFLYWEVVNEQHQFTHLVIAWKAAVFNLSSNRERGKIINWHWKLIPTNTDGSQWARHYADSGPAITNHLAKKRFVITEVNGPWLNC
jgi:hypothetical protein